MKTYLLILLVISYSCTKTFGAECTQNVQKAPQGSVAPCPGWHVSEPTMQNMAKTADELELTKKLVQAQEHLQKLSNDEIEFYKQRSSAQSKHIDKLETQKFWVGAGALVLGVVLTGVAAKAAIEAAR